MENTQQQPGDKMVPRTNSPVLKAFANVITYFFHPVFMPTMVAFILYNLSATSFAGVSPHDFGKWMMVIIINTMFFPLVLVALLKGLGFITSIRMYDPKDRIIPLIGTMVFYFWAYHVFATMASPFLLRVLLLGAFWGVIVVFMVNIFFKASIHAAASGSFIGIMLILMFISPVSMVFPFFLSLICGGLVGSARLILGAHKPSQIYLGYLLGIIVQVAAYFYLR